MDARETNRLYSLVASLEEAAEGLEKTHSYLTTDLIIENFGPVDRIDPDDLQGVLALPILREIAALRINLERQATKVRNRLNDDRSEPPF